MSLVITEVSDNVGIIRLNDPGNRNRLSEEILSGVRDGISAHEGDREVGIVRFELPGCAGADLKGILDCGTDLALLRNLFGSFSQTMLMIARSPKMVTCAVTGDIYGGAVGIVAACDAVYGWNGLKLALSEIKFRFGPNLIGAMVRSRIGPAAFYDLALTGEVREAGHKGHRRLFRELIAEQDGVVPALSTLEQGLLEHGGAALGDLKRTLWDGRLETIEAAASEGVDRSALRCAEPDVQEMLRAFKKKRDADKSGFSRGFVA